MNELKIIKAAIMPSSCSTIWFRCCLFQWCSNFCYVTRYSFIYWFRNAFIVLAKFRLKCLVLYFRLNSHIKKHILRISIHIDHFLLIVAVIFCSFCLFHSDIFWNFQTNFFVESFLFNGLTLLILFLLFPLIFFQQCVSYFEIKPHKISINRFLLFFSF